MKWFIVLLSSEPVIKKVSAETAHRWLTERDLDETVLNITLTPYPYFADIRTIALDDYSILVRWSKDGH